MIAGIIRSWLRPAHAQPVDDEDSSLHVHVDAEGRANDQIYWEKEKERERKRTARANTRTQAAAGGSSIELAPRLPIFHGTGSPTTEGPVPSVNELVAPVLDRKAARFPAHGGGAIPTAHLHPNPVGSAPPVVAPPVPLPPSQPRSGQRVTTSATFNMAENHDHYVPPPGGFSEPSAEEYIALAAAEADRQREQEDALLAPAPPLPSQSPALSDVDYRTMNLSPGPAPSFLEPYYSRQNPPVTTEAFDQPTVHQMPLQQSVAVTSQNNGLPPNRASSSGAAMAPVPAVASGSGVVFGPVEDAKLRQHKSHKKVAETEAIAASGSGYQERGKDRQHHSHHHPDKRSSSKRDKDKGKHEGRTKHEHKHRDTEERKDRKGKRGKTKEKKQRLEDRHKEPIVQNPSEVAPASEIGTILPSKPPKEKENVPPPVKVIPSQGILKSTEEGTRHSRRSDGDMKASHGGHRSRHHRRKTETTDSGEKKTVKFRTPEEQAAHDKRKQERAEAKRLRKAVEQAAKTNEGIGGSANEEVASTENKPPEKHHKHKSSTHRDGNEKKRHRRREGETEEERSQRKAERRARKLADAVKVDPLNIISVPSPVEGNKRHSGLFGRVLSPVPERSTPADSIRPPLSPTVYPIHTAASIPGLHELPAQDVIRNQAGPSGEPVAYKEAQIPPRPSTPPPAAYLAQPITLPPAAAAQIAQPRRKRSYEEKIVVLSEPVQPSQAGRSRHRTNKTKAPVMTPLVPHLVAATPVSKTPESKEERRRRKIERAQPNPQKPSQLYPPPAAAIVPPEEAQAARQHRKKRSPEEKEAKRLKRIAKIAAANAELQAINENEVLNPTSATRQTQDSRQELSAYQENALRSSSVLGLHQPDPRTQPGFGHYGYGTDGQTIGLTSPPPGRGPRHRKSVTIDTGARGGGPSYVRDGRERERERERERQRKEREKETKAREAREAKEAKAREAREAKEAKSKAQNTSGKRFGMFSLKRSFSKLFRA